MLFKFKKISFALLQNFFSNCCKATARSSCCCFTHCKCCMKMWILNMIGLTNGQKSAIFNSDEGFPYKKHVSSISLIPYSASSIVFFGKFTRSKAVNPVRWSGILNTYLIYLIKSWRIGWIVFSINTSISNWVYDLQIYQTLVGFLAMSKKESTLWKHYATCQGFPQVSRTWATATPPSAPPPL